MLKGQGKEPPAICISYRTFLSLQRREVAGGFSSYSTRESCSYALFILALKKHSMKIFCKVSYHCPSTKYLNLFLGMIFPNI